MEKRDLYNAAKKLSQMEKRKIFPLKKPQNALKIQIKALQLAQARRGSGRCPISMPGIKIRRGFQPVEALQIEPMYAQAHPPYNNYDLVMGKPAGVLIHLDKARIDISEEFGLKCWVFFIFYP